MPVPNVISDIILPPKLPSNTNLTRRGGPADTVIIYEPVLAPIPIPVTLAPNLVKLTALTFPLKNAFDAVTSPFAFTLKFDDDIKNCDDVAAPDK